MAKPDLTPSPPLIWLRTFEAAARRLSFTAAAGELGLTQAAVSQQIRLLEAKLKTTRFRSRRRGVELTPEGAAYLPHVQAAFGSLARSTAELFGPRAAHVIAVRSPISFATLWLAPRLPALAAALPNIRLAVTTIHVPSDYSSDGGLDIQFGGGSFPGRTAHRLTSERLVPVAAPSLLARGTERGPADWASLPLLAVSGAREMWPDW